MTEYVLDRIGVLSFAKVYAVVLVTLTALFGWPVLFFEAAVPGSGVASFVFLLVSGAFWGVIGGAVTALVYNVAAAPLGGVVLDLGEA